MAPVRSSPRLEVCPPRPSALLAGALSLVLSAACGSRGAGEGTSELPLVERSYPAFAAAMGRTSWPAPSPAVTRIRRAMASGSLASARRMAAEERARHPDDAHALYLESDILCRTAQYETARPGFEEVLARGPRFAGAEYAFLAYGRCLMSLGEGERARESLLAFLKLHPGHGEALSVLGLLELADGNPDRAIRNFDRTLEALETVEAERGIDMRANRARMLASEATAYLQKDELEKALSALRSSLQLDPRAPRTHYTLSRVFTRLGDTDGARRAMRNFELAKAAAVRARAPSGGSGKPGAGGGVR